MKETKAKVYNENISIIESLSTRLGVSFTQALNQIVGDWELTRQTIESRREDDRIKKY